jgi:hypothetical protein
VLYVLGNHEYYGSTWPGMLDELRTSAEGTNVTVLEDSAVEVGEVRFFGCTLWTDFALLGDRDLAMAIAGHGLNDYRQIRVSPEGRRLRPADTLAIHEASVRWLREELGRWEGPEVVVTHAPPSPRSLVGRETVTPLAAAFLSDLEGLILEAPPDLWIHGHLHDPVDYTVGQTRILANPRGYAFEENPGFDPRLVVEIGG